MPYNTNTSNVVKAARMRNNWTVAKMSKYLGVATSTVNNYEQGRKIPRPVMTLLQKLKR